MDMTRLWIIGAVLAMLAIGGLGWALGVQPQLDAASAADAQTRQVRSANDASRAVLDRLREDSENLPALTQTLTELDASVPSRPDLPGFTAELNDFAAATGVTVSAWQISDAQPFAPPEAQEPAAATPQSEATTAPAPSPSPSPGATSTPSPEPPAAPTPGSPPVPSPLLADARLAVLPVSVTVTGDYAHILGFVEAAQTGGRLFLVNGVSIAPGSGGDGLDGTVSGYIYVLGNGGSAAPQN